MSRTIDVSEETYARLSQLVNPLFNMDAVISALLNRAEGAPAPAPPKPQALAQTATYVTEAPKDHGPRLSGDSVGTSTVRRVVVSRARRGESTDRRVYMRHILAELARAGGSCNVDDMRQTLEKRLVPQLKPTDVLTLPKKPNEPRWWNHTRFARQRLVDNGLLRNDSSYGTWELTEEGWKKARALLRNINDRTVELP